MIIKLLTGLYKIKFLWIYDMTIEIEFQCKFFK